MKAPSRHSNPFATCWTKPGAAPFVPAAGMTPHDLFLKLSEHDWRAQLVGPHGAGKSTLLRQLQPLAQAAGRDWQRVDIHPEHKRAACRQLRAIPLAATTLLVIDGYEQLSQWRQWQIRRSCLRAGAGLLVTTHRPTSLATLAILQPDVELGLQVFSLLTAECSTPVTAGDYRNAFNACDGNLREVFFNLYDLHERRNRIAISANLAAPQSVMC